MTEPDELWRYAKQATAAISSRADRRAARAELHEHALARYEDALATGATAPDALRDTLARLGGPAEYAADLRRASRPSMGPGNLALLVTVAVVVTVIVIALVVWFFWANGAYSHY